MSKEIDRYLMLETMRIYAVWFHGEDSKQEEFVLYTMDRAWMELSILDKYLLNKQSSINTEIIYFRRLNNENTFCL